MKSLSIIGCGNVGKTLAKLWFDKHIYTIGHILNSSTASAFSAKQFIGSGEVAHQFNELRASDIWLIATPDDCIEDACIELARTKVLREGDLVFHPSGALTSASLRAANVDGAIIASLHPIKSFVSAKASVSSFNGTYCTFEGDVIAKNILEPAIERIGGHVFSIQAKDKSLYHTGTTILCNYLCTLMDFGLTALETSGLDKYQAMKAVTPILNETMRNVLSLDSHDALTGPIARGDVETVRKQSVSIKENLPQYVELFSALGLMTSDISKAKGLASDDQLNQIRQLLEQSTRT